MAQRQISTDPVQALAISEPMKTAFAKIDLNFSELYSGAGASPPGGAAFSTQYNNAGAFGGAGPGAADQVLMSTGALSAPTMQAITVAKVSGFPTNKLAGRSTAGTGALEAITIGTNLTLAGGTLNASGGGSPGGSSTQVQVNNAGAFDGFSTFTYDHTTDTLAYANVINAPGLTTFGQTQQWNIFPSAGGHNVVTWDDFGYSWSGFAFRMILPDDQPTANTAFELYNELGPGSGGLAGYILASGTGVPYSLFPNVPAGPCISFAAKYAGYPLYIGVDGVGAAFGVDATTANALLYGVLTERNKETLTPVAAATVTLAKHTTIIRPAGTIASLTVNMPASPINGQEHRVTFSQIVTTLTVSGNGNSIVAAPTTAAVGTRFTYMFESADTTWYPV